MGCTFRKAPTAPRKPSCRRNLADMVPCSFSMSMLPTLAGSNNVSMPISGPLGMSYGAEERPCPHGLQDYKGKSSGSDIHLPHSLLDKMQVGKRENFVV